MNKARVEALTDGIIAIAATIMVLELGVPKSNDWAGLMTLRITFLAYLNSFFLIYNVWYLHHDLFHHVKILSKPAFLINGLWIFILTLVPFTTAWVGNAPDAFLPEFLYPMNLLLWSLSFHWLDHHIQRDNPGLAQNRPDMLPARVIMYGCYLLYMLLAHVKPILSIYLIGSSTGAVFIRIFFFEGKKKESENDG